MMKGLGKYKQGLLHTAVIKSIYTRCRGVIVILEVPVV